MIEIIGKDLYQWDVGRSVKVTDTEADSCHFANKGDLKAVVMDVVDSQAKIPDYLLQTGKQLCVYAVKDGVTIKSITFFVSKRERPEHYVYEDDQRNYIYKLISDAENAVKDANLARDNANLAAADAHSSSAKANTATENANKAARTANEASKNANDAAAKAAHTAKALMVVGSAAGDVIHLDDAIDQFFVGMRIFGKTTQDGVPTPEAPVDLVSVGDDGNIGVTVVGKNLVDITKATPTGTERIEVKDDTIVIDAGAGLYGVTLSGVVLDVGRTYTMSVGNVSQHDVNFGFRILYDDGTSSNTYGDNSLLTITVTKPVKSVHFYVGYGVSATSQIMVTQLQIEEGATRTAYEPYHVQPLIVSTPNGLLGIPVTTGGNYTDENGQQWVFDEIDFDRGVLVKRTGIVDMGTLKATLISVAAGNLFRFEVSDIKVSMSSTIMPNILCEAYPTVSTGDRKHRTLSMPVNSRNVDIINNDYTDADTIKASVSGVMLLYELATPIETPLPAEELAAYNALHTYKDHTTVSNDGFAHMELQYVMDAKKYIDSQIATGILEATVE